mmetsp:Transcript_87901/g.250638  ORF Transcript_87901/g.250638 Transcript_87901/m.250638 type:complete len:238 (-) Transcript_87901:654-1367(-)
MAGERVEVWRPWRARCGYARTAVYARHTHVAAAAESPVASPALRLLSDCSSHRSRPSKPTLTSSIRFLRNSSIPSTLSFRSPTSMFSSCTAFMMIEISELNRTKSLGSPSTICSSNSRSPPTSVSCPMRVGREVSLCVHGAGWYARRGGWGCRTHPEDLLHPLRDDSHILATRLIAIRPIEQHRLQLTQLGQVAVAKWALDDLTPPVGRKDRGCGDDFPGCEQHVHVCVIENARRAR